MQWAINKPLKEFYDTSGAHWLTTLLNPGATQWIAPNRTVLAQLWVLGSGGRGGNTAKGSNNKKSNAGGGGAGGLAISDLFFIKTGNIITVSISGNSTAVFAPAGINLFGGAGGNGGSGNSNGAGTQGPGGGASGGLINVTGGNGGSGNAQNGRGGGGGAPNNTDAGGGFQNGWQGFCMADVGGLFAVMNAVGLGTPLCGPNSTPASNGTAGGRGTGGSGASRTSSSGNGGGAGGAGFIIVRYLVKN